MNANLTANSPVPNDLGLAIPGDLPFFEVLVVLTLMSWIQGAGHRPFSVITFEYP